MFRRFGLLILRPPVCSGCMSGAPSMPSTSVLQISRNHHSTSGDKSVTLYPGTDVTVEEAWKRRIQLRQPKLQRDEEVRPKLYYASEWDLEKRHDGEEGEAYPMLGQAVMTPEKWNYYNKVIWPPNYISPETGLPLLRQVYYCRESIHCSPKRMFMACHLVWRLNVDEALEQLKLQRKKACMILRQALMEAKKKASTEIHVEYPSDMHVAEAFPIQCQIVKGFRRHARERITVTRYRYINLFVRLEEGDGPGMKNRWVKKNGWDKMEDYYKYLRERYIEYSI